MKKISLLCTLLCLSFLLPLCLKYTTVGNQIRLLSAGVQSSESSIQGRKILPKSAEIKAEAGQTGQIRVLIKNDDYASEYHNQICLYCPAPYRICSEEESWEYAGGERCQVLPDSICFSETDTITVCSDGAPFYFPELKRAEEGIAYTGYLEICKTEQGLLLINELPLETYLKGVLPCEMSDAFPIEALKAQAICARTYALQQKEEQRAAAYYADVDDSTSYQVYNNRHAGKNTDRAVEETAGLVMIQGEQYVDARYYSTSCGLDLQMNLSEETVFAAFLQEEQIFSLESEEPLFRWTTEVDLENFREMEEWETVETLEVTERSEKGAAVKLQVTGKKEGKPCTEQIEGEYGIRKFLAQTRPAIVLQDGSRKEQWDLLPSAFFLLRPIMEQETLTGYQIYGGGYGHGIGMSQNGAKHMAEHGRSCEQILKQYFGDMEIVSEQNLVKRCETEKNMI